MTQRVYPATVLEWIDGDTVRLDVDLGFEIRQTMLCRLAGINTPELRSKDAAEAAAAAAARAYAEKECPPGTKLTAVTVKPKEKYGRYLATLLLYDSTSLQQRLLAAGHAKPLTY